MTATSTTRRKRIPRSAGMMAASVGLAFAGLAAPEAPALAATGDLTCTVSSVLSFSPPLTDTNTSADVADTAQLTNCASLNGNYSALTSGTVKASGTARAQSGVPCKLLLTATGTGTFAWQNGQRSGFTFTVNTDPGAGTATLSAKITSGPLSGDTVTAVPVEANPNPDCATAGLKSLSLAVVQLVIA